MEKTLKKQVHRLTQRVDGLEKKMAEMAKTKTEKPCKKLRTNIKTEQEEQTAPSPPPAPAPAPASIVYPAPPVASQSYPMWAYCPYPPGAF
jgi:hypothetical protein